MPLSEAALWDLYHRAERRYKAGQFEEAEVLFRQTVQGREGLLGSNDRNTLWSKYFLGRTLQYLKRYGEAEYVLRQTVKGRQETLGPEDPDTVWSKYWLGESLFYQQKYAEAEEVFRQTVQARQKRFGPDNFDTLWSKYYLGTTLRRLRKYDEAEEVLQETLEGRKKAYGIGHSDTLWCKYWLAVTLFDHGKFVEAEDLFQQTVDGRAAILGPTHADTLWSKSYLGRVLRCLGKYEEAARELKETCEGRKEIFGTDNLDTVWAMHWMAETLHDQGQYDDAAALFRVTLEVREKALGWEHPETQLSKCWLGRLEVMAKLLELQKGKDAGPRASLDSAIFSSADSELGSGDTELSEDWDSLAASAHDSPNVGNKRGPFTTAPWSEVTFDSAEPVIVPAQHISMKNADEWLRHISKVHNFFSLYRRTPVIPAERVDILLIDSGIDLTHPVFKEIDPDGNQISAAFCRDFINGESPVTDSTGHGTHCAHTILKICKTARIYVAKVFGGNTGDQETVKRIVEAIAWGVEQGVDIICMAFAFSHPHQAIGEAIRRANGQRNRLFLAAASNNKHYSEDPVGFPANMDEVICVNSCSNAGIQSRFSPPGGDKRGDNLSTLGEDIPAAKAAVPGAKNAGGKKLETRMSGTSVATAVMTGIAALVIEYSRLEAAPSINPPGEEEGVDLGKELLTNAGMKSVLYNRCAGMNPPKPPQYSHIRPWLLFDERNQHVVDMKIREAIRMRI